DVIVADVFDGARGVGLAQRSRQGTGNARRAHGARRGIVGDALTREVAEEAADRRQRALHTARTQSTCTAVGDEGADIGGGELRQCARIDAATQMLFLEIDESS